jgi:5-phospho-D-xylono-1,4-lactonase
MIGSQVNYISTVTGDFPWNTLGITDAHNHVWIESVAGSNPKNPVLKDFANSIRELEAYRQAGGQTILDCQPGGCGRNGSMLARLSLGSNVKVISATGFHRPVYYSPDFWLLTADEDQITRWFIAEIETGETETLETDTPVRAGFIKIACEDTLTKTCLPGLKAAAQAAKETGKCIAIHTEKGQSAEEILTFFSHSGVELNQIIFCHMDKRPDFGLHRELVQAGAALEYDTFYRTKYTPETHLWPLITHMVDTGLDDHVCLATDMAESEYWSSYNNGPGLASLPSRIRQHLFSLGFSDKTIDGLIGMNICRILAGEFSKD